MKRWESSETRFGKVSCRLEPCWKGKQPFKVSKTIENFVKFKGRVGRGGQVAAISRDGRASSYGTWHAEECDGKEEDSKTARRHLSAVVTPTTHVHTEIRGRHIRIFRLHVLRLWQIPTKLPPLKHIFLVGFRLHGQVHLLS